VTVMNYLSRRNVTFVVVSLIFSKTFSMNTPFTPSSSPQAPGASFLGGELYEAALKENLSAVIKLIEDGANINACVAGGRTILHHLTLLNKENMTDFFISCGAFIAIEDVYGRTPLHYAAYAGNLVIVKLLIRAVLTSFYKKGWNCDEVYKIYSMYCNHQDKDGKTPLHFALAKEHYEVVFFLFRCGADPFIFNNHKKGQYHYVDKKYQKDVLLLFNGMRKSFSNVDYHFTPLHDAAKSNNVERLAELLENDCDVNVLDVAGHTPLHVAAHSNSIDALETILTVGTNVDVNAKSNLIEATPLHYAARNGYKVAVEILLKHGADPFATDFCGKTPLDKAKFNGFYSVVATTIENSMSKNDFSSVEENKFEEDEFDVDALLTI